MKIAKLTPVYIPYRSGTTSVVHHVSMLLAAKGHKVTVITPRVGPDMPDDNSVVSVMRLHSLVRWGNACVVKDLDKALEGFDAVHLYYPFFGTAEFLWQWKRRHPTKKMIITYVMDFIGGDPFRNLLSLPSRLFFPRLVEESNRVVTASFDYLTASNIHGIFQSNHNKFIEIPYGADGFIHRSSCCNGESLLDLGIADGVSIVLFVGALDRAHRFKGVDVLIRSMARISSTVMLVIVGDGDMRRLYKTAADMSGIGDRVVFTGQVNDSTLNRLYNRCKVLILPSTTAGEAFGIVLLNAMACGKPVIASDLPGVRQVVGTGGLLFRPSDHIALADAVNRLIENKILSSQLGENGYRQYCERYNWEAVGWAYEKLYADI